MQLLKIAKEVDDIIKPFGEFEVLLFYGIVAEKLSRFLAGRELAAKNWIPPAPNFKIPYLIKRGSKECPLFIDDFIAAVTPEFLEIRSKTKALKYAKGKITKLQENAWNYFLPRKLSDFFYATNSEGQGKPIDRLFFDIDRGINMSASQAQMAARQLLDIIREDEELNILIGKPETGVFWTGRSFHVFIFLKNAKPNSFYVKYFQSIKNSMNNFTCRWADEIKKETKINVLAGHEKRKNAITIDPSQTPSGKLCRAPFSLHMKDAKTVDGVSLPLTRKMLDENELIKKLNSYTPEKVVKELDKFAARLPKKFR